MIWRTGGNGLVIDCLVFAMYYRTSPDKNAIPELANTSLKMRCVGDDQHMSSRIVRNIYLQTRGHYACL